MRARVFGNGLDSCHSVFDKRCGLFNCTRMKPVGSVIESPQVAEQVADMVGLSRSRLFQLFSEQLASSPLVYRSGIRLEEAVTRLRGRAPQLTELALDLGFSTPGNFSRFFRSHRGVTPSAYRRVLQAA
jgi:AraC family transcriptional regulator